MFTSIYKPRWTFIFIAVCVVAFILEQVTDLWVYLVFFPEFALEAPWMFVTSIFLHADLTHLLFNMIALFFFGRHLEQLIGGRTFVILFLLSGVVGNMGYFVTAGDPLAPALGASGAVYGVIGALAVMTPFTLVLIYGVLPLPLVAAAALWALIDFAGLLVPSGVAHGAHLAGMLVGAIFGMYFRSHRRPAIAYF